jgi:hypothetical protein
LFNTINGWAIMPLRLKCPNTISIFTESINGVGAHSYVYQGGQTVNIHNKTSHIVAVVLSVI